MKETAPAIFAELNKSLDNKKNIQSAVFSECVYAQSLADKFNLSIFENHINNERIKFNFVDFSGDESVFFFFFVEMIWSFSWKFTFEKGKIISHFLS